MARFDSGIDYLEAYGYLLGEYTKYKKIIESGKAGKRDYVKMFFIILALFQLRNGSRVSESARMLFLLHEHGKREMSGITFKHGGERYYILPEIIDTQLFNEVMDKVRSIFHQQYKDKFDYSPAHRTYFLKKLEERYAAWLSRTPIKNSHSLRYAFIRRAINDGIEITQIERILGHKKLGTTYHYGVTYNAAKILKNLKFL